MQSMIEQAYSLEIINDRQRQYLWKQLSALGYRLKEPIDIPRENPTLLSEIIQAHMGQLGYTVGDLSNVLCLTPAEFRSWYPVEDSRPKLFIAR